MKSALSFSLRHASKSLESYIYNLRVYTGRCFTYCSFPKEAVSYIYLSQKLKLGCFFFRDIFVSYEDVLKYNSCIEM